MNKLFSNFTKKYKTIFMLSFTTVVILNVLAYFYMPVLLPYTLSGIICVYPSYKLQEIYSSCSETIFDTRVYKLIMSNDSIALTGITISFMLSLCLHKSILLTIFCVIFIVVHVIGLANMHMCNNYILKRRPSNKID